ncbi:MAG: ATP-dependent zinc metalloprotease FtsH [Cyclobacteriaceae bacterium]
MENRDLEDLKKKKGNESATPPQRPFNLLAYLIPVLFFLAIYYFTAPGEPSEISWNKFKREMLTSGDVDYVSVVNKERVEVYILQDRLLKEEYKEVDGTSSGPHFFFLIGSIDTFESNMSEAQEGLDFSRHIEIKYESRTDWFDNIFTLLLPFGLILLFWFFLIGRAGKGAGGKNMFNFGKSTARFRDANSKQLVTFKDVAGLDEAKTEVNEIVDFLKNPTRYTALGAKIPKGVILVGPPGTGKTLLVKAVAGESKVPFFSISGSEFVEMFVGVGASRVRDLFNKAKEKAPCIIFIDEIDAIGRSRGNAKSFQSNDERESTLNQLLTEMDGFGSNSGVIVIAATNRADMLDRALIRPGRFDRHIYLELPNRVERKAIFEVHLRPLKLAADLDVDFLSTQTPGFSGADIANVCNEAALIAARNNKKVVEEQDFVSAMDRIIGGLEKKSKVISPKERKIVAHHEAGHAVVSWMLKNADPLVKVSIIPRGKSLGAAWYLPEEHQIYTKSQFLDQMCIALGGRAAEQLIFNEASSGALDDLEKVTKLAHTLVAFYGLNETIGNLSYFDSTGEYERLLTKPYSEDTAQIIDEEVRKLVKESFKRATEILQKNEKKLIALAHELLDKETIFKEDLERILGARKGRKKEKKLSVTTNHD